MLICLDDRLVALELRSIAHVALIQEKHYVICDSKNESHITYCFSWTNPPIVDIVTHFGKYLKFLFLIAFDIFPAKSDMPRHTAFVFTLLNYFTCYFTV